MLYNIYILSSGGGDNVIVDHDVRQYRHEVRTLKAHSQGVCQLRWNPNGQQLASGGNDGVVNIWDIRKQNAPAILCRYTSATSARALAWCTFESNMLASSGRDGDINIWHTSTGTCVKTVHTNSQVVFLSLQVTQFYVVSPFTGESITVGNELQRTSFCTWTTTQSNSNMELPQDGEND